MSVRSRSTATFSQHVHAAADPVDFDRGHPLVSAQAEVQPRTPVALVAAAAVDFVDLHQVAGDDADPGSDAVAVGLDAAEPDLQPVVLRAVLVEHVAEDRGRPARVEDHHVDAAVIVQVFEGDAAAHGA